MNIYKDFDLSRILWYRIGGKARFLLEVSDKEDLLKALDFIEKNNIEKHFVIGLGSNLLFSDEPYDGAVIRFVSAGESTIDEISSGLIYSSACEILDSVIDFALRNNLTGLEWAGGLPGLVGAAVRGNVGAFGGEVKDVLEEAEVLKMENGKWKLGKLNNLQMEFSYRNSLVKKNKDTYVISAFFRLKNAGISKTETARQTYIDHIEHRRRNNPLEYPNCGSVFKNIIKKEEVEVVLDVLPELKENVDKKWHGKVSMGALIGKLGLSGFQVGKAQVSPKHNNFIVNLGGASFMDVLTIIRKIQNDFMDTFGFMPEVEVEIVE